MAKKQNPRELMSAVLELIAKDIEQIEKVSNEKLSGEVSSCLVRYSDALLKIVKDHDSQKEDEQAKANRLSNEELLKAAEALVKKSK